MILSKSRIYEKNLFKSFSSSKLILKNSIYGNYFNYFLKKYGNIGIYSKIDLNKIYRTLGDYYIDNNDILSLILLTNKGLEKRILNRVIIKCFIKKIIEKNNLALFMLSGNIFDFSSYCNDLINFCLYFILFENGSSEKYSLIKYLRKQLDEGEKYWTMERLMQNFSYYSGFVLNMDYTISMDGNLKFFEN